MCWGDLLTDNTLKTSFLWLNGTCFHVVSLLVKMAKEKLVVDFHAGGFSGWSVVLILRSCCFHKEL